VNTTANLQWQPHTSDIMIGGAFTFTTHSNGCIIIIYVDDVLAMALTKAIIESAVSGPLRDAFKLRELGDVGFYLGCRILRDFE
jgi:hypothetical protein